MNGVLNLNKPTGWTSHDVVAKVRGLIREKQIGHLGTLDPLATGVLPLAVGLATPFGRTYPGRGFKTPRNYRTDTPHGLSGQIGRPKAL